ncbi:lysylphosphatidylglycerol synthase domain-containing protein [Nocardioides sp. GXQ0305]|uniref:lysylphosphatidylglycerol synthase domain-containing protein n=1 Tax=Nocardioides sp. GXQ0305 TaxID=3423912 RepID=UPI003D7EFCED
MTRGRWSWAVGAAVLVVVVVWVGTEPFVAGVRSLDLTTLALGVVLGGVVTAAGAWRWRLVARGLGLEVATGQAIAACYRSQLINVVLPGGVLGDVLRGVDTGRTAGDAPRGLRSVAWERTAGQLVQAAIVVAVLLTLPSPFRSTLPAVVAGLVVVLAAVVALRRALPVLRDDLAGMLRQRVWPGVLLASVVVVAGLATTYVVAARAVGVTAPVTTLLPLALLVLVAAAVPANLAGWGPREGVAAWAFGAAGLGAAQGVAVSVAFGVLVLVAALPGAVVLAAGTLRRRLDHAPEPALGGGGRG